jgi:hypothetical protein
MKDDKHCLDSGVYSEKPRQKHGLPAWFKVGAVAAASVLAGGLAVSWFYRNTLARLRQAEQTPDDSNFGMKNGRTDDEI